jgi:hypothetical protein
MNSTGISAATKAAVMETMVKPSCRVPASAACIAVSPSSMRRMMFSMTITASSTTKPTAMISAISVRLSRL